MELGNTSICRSNYDSAFSFPLGGVLIVCWVEDKTFEVFLNVVLIDAPKIGFKGVGTRFGYSGIMGTWPPAPPAKTTNELVINRLSSFSLVIRSVHSFWVGFQVPERTVVIVQIFWGAPVRKECLRLKWAERIQYHILRPIPYILLLSHLWWATLGTLDRKCVQMVSELCQSEFRTSGKVKCGLTILSRSVYCWSQKVIETY